MTPIRVVVDTNVFIKAIFFNDESCKAIFRYKQNGLIRFCMNKKMYNELILIFGRAVEKNKMTREMSRLVYYFGNTLWEIERVEHLSSTNYCDDDEEDNKFIDCCIDGNIEYIICRDGDLISAREHLEEIKQNHNIELNILSPFQFSRELLRLKY